MGPTVVSAGWVASLQPDFAGAPRMPMLPSRDGIKLRNIAFYQDAGIQAPLASGQVDLCNGIP